MKAPCSKCGKAHLRDEMYWVLPPLVPEALVEKAIFVCKECWGG